MVDGGAVSTSQGERNLQSHKLHPVFIAKKYYDYVLDCKRSCHPSISLSEGLPQPPVPNPPTSCSQNMAKKRDTETSQTTSPHLFQMPSLTLRKALRSSHFNITFGEPFTGLDQLHHIQKLLPGHDRERHPGDDPWPEAVHLVGTSQLHRPGTARGCEEGGRLVRRASRLSG